MQNQRWLYALIGGFIAGVAFRSFVDLGWSFSFFLLLIGVMLTFAHSLIRANGRITFLTICLVAAGLGMLRLNIADIRQGDPLFEAKVGSSVVAEGTIIEEPDERENQTLLTVRFEKVGAEALHDTVLVGTARFPEFHYGDFVQVIGKLEKPKSFETDTGRVFNYPQFLAKDGIFYQISFAKVSLLNAGSGNPLKRALFAIKDSFLSRVSRVIPEPQASLMGGLVVGAKQSLGKELLDAFRMTGIIHIVVLSGFNITIVANFIMRFFGMFLRKRGSGSLIAGGISIVLFVIMVGASATAVRAGAMALIGLLALATGRTSAITHALILTGFLMVLHNPYILLFDPSFQLSFLATLGLIQISPRIEARIMRVPKFWGLRTIIAATLATQLFVLPLLLYNTGQFSVVGLLVNLLILPLIPITMLFGFLTGVAGFLSTILSMPFAFISYALLTYELKIVELFSSLPFASVTIPYFPAWLMVLLYAALAAFLWLKTRPKHA